MGVAGAALSFQGTQFPERNGCRFVVFAASLFAFGGSLASLSLAGELRFFNAFFDACGMFVSCRENAPGTDTAGFRNGQADHLRVDEANLAVEQVPDVRQQAFRRIKGTAAQLDCERNADMLRLQAQTRHLAQRDALRRLFFRRAERSCAQQEQTVAHLATELFHQVLHLGTGIEAVVFHFNEPEFFFAGMVEHKVHFLATVAKVLRVAGVKGGTLRSADQVARIELEAVHSLYARDSGLAEFTRHGAQGLACSGNGRPAPSRLADFPTVPDHPRFHLAALALS